MSEINQRSNLSTHCKSSARLKRKEIKSKGSSFNENTFIDCGETIKLEDIKEEIRGEGNGDDPLSIHQETENSNIFRDIKEKVKQEESVEDPLPIQEGKRRIKNDNICSEVKEEGIDDDTLCVQEIHNYDDEENNKVANEIDIVEYKI